MMLFFGMEVVELRYRLRIDCLNMVVLSLIVGKVFLMLSIMG